MLPLDLGKTRALINVIDEDNNRICLSDNGVSLCLRINDKADIGNEITFSPYGFKETFTVKVVCYLRSIMTKSVRMSDRLADKSGINYSISAKRFNSCLKAF